MEDGLTRSQPCPTCGAGMLWTQNAWKEGGAAGAAYRCLNGHVLDPETTRQCPHCGVHDTELTDTRDGRQHFHCLSCGESFTYPR